MQEDRSDVLIVGGGIAGITTAIDLFDGHKSVLLLDRDQESAFGGLARESFGGMFFVDSPEQRRQGIRDSAELARRDWYSFAEFGADDHWPRAWAESYVQRCTADVYRWVRGFGVRFLPVVNWVERGEFRPGNSVPRFHVAWGTGKGIAEALIAALLGHRNADRLTLRFNRRVERLVLRGGRIDGVAGVDETNGAPFEARAEQVVVAAGGINGDLDRVRQNWHRDWGKAPAELLNGSHRFADGRLHDAVAASGGALTHLDKMWNYAAGVHHPRPRKANHGLSLVPPRSALWLSWRGGGDRRGLPADERQWSDRGRHRQGRRDCRRRTAGHRRCAHRLLEAHRLHAGHGEDQFRSLSPQREAALSDPGRRSSRDRLKHDPKSAKRFSEETMRKRRHPAR
jgi:uncharacterized protein